MSGNAEITSALKRYQGGIGEIDATYLQRQLYVAGLVIVPIVPSMAMLAAGMSEHQNGLREAYRAMIEEASAALGYELSA